MNILIDTPDYPDRYKVHYPFVKQLVMEFARQGHQCVVMAPYSITNNKRFYPFVEDEGSGVRVYRPNYMSFSNVKIGNLRLSDYFRKKALYRAIRKLKTKPDIVYCHFWESVSEVYPYAKANSLPLFVASGESSIKSFLDPEQISSEIREYVSGVVCVSTKNKDESVGYGLTTAEKCFVKPNAVNSELFKKLDKKECRRKLGVSDDVFIVSFVGAFIPRKGALRVSKAIERLNDKPVCSFFIGHGNEVPSCDNILYKGKLLHEQIPVYLNASDAFVLPTQGEGCCNAIIEAMACGLPIISSNLPFNWDILDESNSILIDPDNITSIVSAIQELRDNQDKRKTLSEGALRKAEELTIDKRAESIIKFIESRI